MRFSLVLLAFIWSTYAQKVNVYLFSEDGLNGEQVHLRGFDECIDVLEGFEGKTVSAISKAYLSFAKCGSKLNVYEPPTKTAAVILGIIIAFYNSRSPPSSHSLMDRPTMYI